MEKTICKGELRLAVIAIYFLTIIPTIAQDISINGKLIDKTTKDPIPYASIGISNTSYGTATDEAGIFHLKIKSDYKGGSLAISSIGYNTARFSIDSLSSLNNIVLTLMPSAILLNAIEVNAKPVNPLDVIQMSLDSINVNYRQNGFNLIFYSVMNCKSTVLNQHYKIESIINGYYDGYSSVAKKRFEIISKKSEGDNPLAVSEYPFWPTLELHRADLIADPAATGIFNKKNLDKFDFEYKGITVFDADTVYKILYNAPKPSFKITGYRVPRKFYKGTVYITTNTLAIVKHEIETNEFSYTIIYRKFGNEYFPYLVRGLRTQTGSGVMANITNLVRLLFIELDQINKLDYKTNEFNNLASLPEDESFWMDR
ncbi:hypothetical protein SanaruYs_30510 [Chryseotalea sanaruensis]|uniref:Carboxypeptidase-like regulatory domain-containing protein n=1 Tax=Chryseotalea sanaruensis TaxID=2482724 RepID=A0A401UD87_9BACT|nr:carboxypeptidase-like regulatory domain-containing protein [Chryseotalea sanaruensis]GCC52812.1 hypothetical protein SanaruYs_30510 [Chryseotalea sanaruensis]